MAGKFQGILLLSDMDGTLLNDEKQVPPENVGAIEYFIGQGGLFSIASGRTHQSVARYFDVIPVNAAMIALNGTILYDPKTGKVLWNGEIDKESAKAVIREVLRRFPYVGLEIYTEEGVHIVSANSYTRSHMVREQLKNYEDAALDRITLPWYKALFAEENAKLKPIEAFIAESGLLDRYPALRYVYSESYFYEVLGANISKGTALRKLADLCRIPREKTFAIGDHYNDAELITAAGFSFAPKSAVEPIKKAASRVLSRDNNQGAVAEAIALLDKMF